MGDGAKGEVSSRRLDAKIWGVGSSIQRGEVACAAIVFDIIVSSFVLNGNLFSKATDACAAALLA